MFSLRARLGDLQGTEVLVWDSNSYVTRPGAVTKIRNQSKQLCHFKFVDVDTHSDVMATTKSPTCHPRSQSIAFNTLSVHEIQAHWVSSYHVNRCRSMRDLCQFLSPCVLESGPNICRALEKRHVQRVCTSDLICTCSVRRTDEACMGQAGLVRNSLGNSITSLSSRPILNPILRCRFPRYTQ